MIGCFYFLPYSWNAEKRRIQGKQLNLLIPPTSLDNVSMVKSTAEKLLTVTALEHVLHMNFVWNQGKKQNFVFGHCVELKLQYIFHLWISL